MKVILVKDIFNEGYPDVSERVPCSILNQIQLSLFCNIDLILMSK